MSAYLLGLFTLPTLTLAVLAVLRTYWAFEREAARWGWFWQYRNRRGRGYPAVSDYRLRRDLWFEHRTVWPFFSGHWYREEPAGQGHAKAFANRWIGVGAPDGRSFTVYHKRLVGEVDR